METKLDKSDLISVVVPLLNESESLEELGNALLIVAATHGLHLEVLFVDDGSQDGSWDEIRRLAAAAGALLIVDRQWNRSRTNPS